MGVSQNEAAGTGSLSQGSVSRVCFVVCFGGLFRTVLLPRTVKFKWSVSGSVSKVCFGVCFGGLFRQSRTSQPYLKLHSPKKCKPICVCGWRSAHICISPDRWKSAWISAAFVKSMIHIATQHQHTCIFYHLPNLVMMDDDCLWSDKIYPVHPLKWGCINPIILAQPFGCCARRSLPPSPPIGSLFTHII